MFFEISQNNASFSSKPKYLSLQNQPQKDIYLSIMLTQVFNAVIETSEKNDNLAIRLQTLFREITLSVYTNVSRGLFERHKLVYSFMVCVAIFRETGEINDTQWNYLLRGPVVTKTDLPPKPNAAISDATWLAVNYLTTINERFTRLPSEVTSVIRIQLGNFVQDLRIFATARTQSPTNWNEILNDFDKLLLIRTLQEEKLVFAITEYVCMKLGKVFIENPQVSLQIL